MDEVIKPELWLQYGPGGLMALAAAVLLVWVMRSHKDERESWRVDAKGREETFADAIKDIAQTMREDATRQADTITEIMNTQEARSRADQASRDQRLNEALRDVAAAMRERP